LVNLPRNLQELKSSPAVLQRLEEAMKVLENEEPANKGKGLRRLGLKIGGFHGISWDFIGFTTEKVGFDGGKPQ